MSDDNIRDTISTTLDDHNSSLSSLVINLGGEAGLDYVESALNEATSDDNPSDLTTSLDNFLAYLLVNNASLFYEALRTQVQDAVYAYIQDDVQSGGTIYNAIEESLNNYADTIGVGNNGQPYLNVIEAAQAAISNEVQIGGIIETEIQTVAQSAISYEIQSGGIIDTAIQAAINP